MTERVEEIAYGEARRALEIQQLSIETLHTRAGTLLAAASLATTFLGGQALEGAKDPNCFVWFAIAAFILVSGLTITVLLPWKFTFFMDPAELVRDYVDPKPKVDLEEMLRNLTLHYDAAHTSNRKTVGRLQWLFRVAAFLLGAEILAWLPAL